jgi:hypothetical protein
MIRKNHQSRHPCHCLRFLTITAQAMISEPDHRDQRR